MEIIQEFRWKPGPSQVDQWQDAHPDEIIFEDILESRLCGSWRSENVAYAAVHKGNEAAYNEIYDGKWEHDNYMCMSLFIVSL